MYYSKSPSTVFLYLITLLISTTLVAQEEELVDPFGALGAAEVEEETAESETADAGADIPEGIGEIAGQVFDAETGQPIEGVTAILDGTDLLATTDATGSFEMPEVPSGVYTLIYTKSGYRKSKVTAFKVLPDETATADFAMPVIPVGTAEDIFEMDAFEVTAEEASLSVLKLELKLDSDRALDIFSNEDFAKFDASDVADAVKRIAGISVNEGKFPSVRGLNDRYTVTALNGMPLPSPDPFRKSPQLDIFPSNLLDTIVVSKTATADLDGESTAANFDLLTKRLPEEFFIKFSFGTGFHSGSIDKFRSFDRGGNGYLFTDGAADQNQGPRTNPTDALAIPGFAPSEELGSKEKDASPNSSFSLSIGNTIEFSQDRRIGVVFAGYHKRNTSFVEGTDNQDYDFSGADTLVTQLFFLPSPPFPPGLPPIESQVNVPIPFGDETQYDFEQYEENIKLGALFGLSFEFGENHTFFGNAFLSRTADTIVTRNLNGQNPDEDITEDNDMFLLRERLYYVERSLTVGQFGGDHNFPDVIAEPSFNWGIQKARTSQEEPDFRDTIALYRFSDFPAGDIPESVSRDNTNYNINSVDNVALSSNSWRYVQEDEDSVRLDFDLKPVKNWTLLSGGLFRRADRISEIQTYNENRTDSNATNAVVAGTGISTGNLTNGSNAIRGVSEANRDIDAFYIGAKYEPVSWLKLNLGVRLEESNIEVISNTLLPSSNTLANVFRNYDAARDVPFPSPATQVLASEADVLRVPTGFQNTTSDIINTRLEDRIYLQSMGTTITPTEGMQLKLAYYETINRPSFREITGDIFIDIENGDFLGGNPFLQSSLTSNYDFRLELYPGQFIEDISFLENVFHDDDMVGFSAFRKRIQDPIEFIRPSDQNIDEIPFNNPEGATAEGIEFEFNKNLGFLTVPFLEYFSVGGNLSFTDAEVGVSDAERALLGLNENIDVALLGDTRQLTEQPDEIVNLNLTFEQPDWGTTVTLAYNEKSEILQSIGSESSLDAYRGPTERLDLIFIQEFDNGWKIKFAVKNLLDEGYETFFRNRAPDLNNPNISNLDDPNTFAADKTRRSVDTVGMGFSLSAEIEF